MEWEVSMSEQGRGEGQRGANRVNGCDQYMVYLCMKA